MNKFKDIIINHYTNTYNEEERFQSGRSYQIEYLTTMKYIQKYAKKGCSILEVGAGTGAYSLELAKQGFRVTAVDLVPRNVEVMKSKANGLKNFSCQTGDALNLDFENEKFDIVLCLGPMYHLYSQKDKLKAINETIRVCKKGGICMFAYLTHSSIVWGYGVRKNQMAHLSQFLDKTGRIKDCPEEIFSAYFVEDFAKQFKKTNTTFLNSVATDGIFGIMRDYINTNMSDEDYQKLVDWHFSTCERMDQQGLSSHMLYICKKNK